MSAPSQTRFAAPSSLLPVLASLALLVGAVAARADQIGVDDRRISDVGGLGNPDFDAAPPPRIAYAAGEHEFLAVWAADDPDSGPLDNEFEIFGQRLDATTGAELGVFDFMISDMGGLGDPNDGALTPAVAYDSVDHQYLVVWAGTEDDGGTVQGEWEIYVQRLDAVTGDRVGANQRISAMCGIGVAACPVYWPAVAYDPDRNQYLVAWTAGDNRDGMVAGEREIFVQRLDAATGAEIGADDQRISAMGGLGDAAYDAERPAVAYNGVHGEFLVAWYGDDDTLFQTDEELEIFVQRLDAATGAELGADDNRVTFAGPNLDPAFDAERPALAYSPVADRYLVVWQGDDDTPPLVEGELEISSQLLDGADGMLVGGPIRLSAMGPDGSTAFAALAPQVAWNPVDDEFLAVWSGDDDTPPRVDGEFEIHLQRVRANGFPHGTDDERLSAMGPDGSTAFGAGSPGLAVNPRHDEALVVWVADDDTPPLADDELEVFSQRWIQPLLFADGFESGDTARWSSVLP
ncbi:MAG: hypothetical protein F9K18_02065 [Thermoanaerobaculia bacterium]|nr:MAG: hypothetical protein F9K18_02065 [Thermoanaerobaculia bacterium]